MMPFFLRHYSTFADKIIVYDENSTDGTREIVKACPKAELRDWTGRGLNDEEFIAAVNSLYKTVRGRADWVIWADCDELLYHPNPVAALASADGVVVPSTGYALISTNGFPSGSGQIYDYVRMGVRQENYDKMICWKPQISIQHTIGRHTYAGANRWPKFTGQQSRDIGFKLLHCHHVGGVTATTQRNQRNYDRAINKKYAWNFAPDHNSNPKQSGSVAWVNALIKTGKMIDVITKPLLKIQCGCGGHRFDGWENRDIETDIRQPLPFASNSASHIYASHLIEHVTHQQAWNFLAECKRVLVPDGILRVAIPDITQMSRRMTGEYQQAVKNGGHGDGTRESALKAAVFSHGHQAAWNQELLATFIEGVGFSSVRLCDYGISSDHEMCGRELHGQTVGEKVARVETSVVEANK